MRIKIKINIYPWNAALFWLPLGFSGSSAERIEVRTVDGNVSPNRLVLLTSKKTTLYNGVTILYGRSLSWVDGSMHNGVCVYYNKG
mmetsp:Transcript_1912/g.2176  ORF Transcript_1912/g.2176 Transcript_1912/m.2176 type:complete len:86 (+) Transcript_1912:25-282(+)